MGLLASGHYPTAWSSCPNRQRCTTYGTVKWRMSSAAWARCWGTMAAAMKSAGKGCRPPGHGGSGEAGPLLEEVRASFPAGSLRDTLLTVYRDPAPVRVIASCSRPVCTAARRGDSRALHILEAAGIRLAEQAAAMIRRHQLPADIPLCVMGGSFRDIRRYLKACAGRCEIRGKTGESIRRCLSRSSARRSISGQKKRDACRKKP